MLSTPQIETEEQWAADDDQEALWESRGPRQKVIEAKVAPPCAEPEDEYELAERHGRPADAPRSIVLLEDDRHYIASMAEESLRDLEQDESEIGDDSLPVAQYAHMLRDRKLRLTHDFCAAFDLNTSWNPFRHPCGEIRKPGESWDQYSCRRAQESTWFHAIDRALLAHKTDQFWGILKSENSLDVKKAAARLWIGQLAHHSRPVIYPDPQMFSFFGLHWSCTEGASYLRVTPEWRAYQQELAQAREDNRGDRPEQRALTWLKRNSGKALKARISPALRAKVLQRLEVVGWNWTEFKRQTKERGWV